MITQFKKVVDYMARKADKKLAAIRYAAMMKSNQVKRGKAAVDRMFDGRHIFIARQHKKELSSSAESWIKNISDPMPEVVLNVRGLTMPQQYEVAKAFKKQYRKGGLRKVTVDDGPYESSAEMIEQFIMR